MSLVAEVMTVEEALEVALADARASLVQAEAEKAQLEMRVMRLRQEVDGLEVAVARRRGPSDLSTRHADDLAMLQFKGTSLVSPRTPSGDPAVAGVAMLVTLLLALRQDWVTKKRASAVELVLQAAERPLHRREVTQILQRVGRTKDTLADVSAALAYLNRTGRAVPVGDGVWAVPTTSRKEATNV